MECKKCGGKEHNKNEFVKGHQRYKCKNYRYQFVPTLQKGFNEQTKLIAYLLYISGLSLRTIVRLLHISATSVVALFTFKKNKLWIWKAYCTDTGQLIDWECGNRDTNTLKRLLQRLKKWNIKIYITDN